MARLFLVQAMDFQKTSKEKTHGQRSYRQDGQWFLVRFGPGYTNIYRVEEASPEELKTLEQIRAK